MEKRYSMDDLLTIMTRLRDPDSGCPWDIEQTFETIAPYTIEEAYEVEEAIRDRDMNALADELGDLLFQSVFHAQMAREEGAFDFDDVVQAVCEKMVRRHPHVFGNASIEDADAQTAAWETQKARERDDKARAEGRIPSVLDGVTPGLPALLRAVKLQKRAALVGFDWDSAPPILDKLKEEMAELEAALQETPQRVREEFGDLLFVMANLARHLDLDPEQSLRDANAKFERRFKRIEALLDEQGSSPKDASLAKMDALWDQAKGEERG